MTKADIQLKLAKRLSGKKRKELVWADLVTAVGGLLPAEKAAIMQDIRDGRAGRVGRAVTAACYARANSLANDEAAAMLDNDSLDLVELERLL